MRGGGSDCKVDFQGQEVDSEEGELGFTLSEELGTRVLFHELYGFGGKGALEAWIDFIFGMVGWFYIFVVSAKLFGNVEMRKFMDCIGIVASDLKAPREYLKELGFVHGQEPGKIHPIGFGNDEIQFHGGQGAAHQQLEVACTVSVQTKKERSSSGRVEAESGNIRFYPVIVECSIWTEQWSWRASKGLLADSSGPTLQ